jgi:hypothetical protein
MRIGRLDRLGDAAALLDDAAALLAGTAATTVTPSRPATPVTRLGGADEPLRRR